MDRERPSAPDIVADPVSMEEAEALYADLNDTCTRIQAQLSNKDYCDEDGNRIDSKAYHQWRARATWALSQKRIEMSRLKRRIKACKIEAARIEAGVKNPNNSVELFGALLKIARSVWEDLSPQERAIIALAERWIRVKGAPAVVAAREKAKVAS